MASVALLIGLALVIRWVSPLATGLPGLVLLGWTALYVVSPARAIEYIPLKGHNFGLGFAGLGTTGILGAAGVVLVMPLFYFSGAMFPVKGLGAILNGILRLNPLTYGVDGLRGALTHEFAFGLGHDFIFLGLATGILLVVGNYFFSKIEV